MQLHILVQSYLKRDSDLEDRLHMTLFIHRYNWPNGISGIGIHVPRPAYPAHNHRGVRIFVTDGGWVGIIGLVRASAVMFARVEIHTRCEAYSLCGCGQDGSGVELRGFYC